MGLTPMSIDVTMLVIGGLGTIFGPILGTAVLTVIQTWLIDYPGWQLTILGVAAAGHRDLRARRPGGLDQPHGPPGAGVGGGVTAGWCGAYASM